MPSSQVLQFAAAHHRLLSTMTMMTMIMMMMLIASIMITVNGKPTPLGTNDGVWVSHSGPTNALWGHEKLVPEEEVLAREKRRSSYYPSSYRYGYGYGYNNYGSSYGGYSGGYAPDVFQQNWITSEHNRYRRMVPATDMRMVYWNQQLAASAQAHANTCDFRHSRNRANIGENIWAAPYYNYTDAIGRWYNEVNDPWCGCGTGYKHCCGHYTQMVWAETNLIGCGYAQCNGVTGVGGYAKAVFVCHYNPQGNKVMYYSNGGDYAMSAFTWARSESDRCSQCPSDQPSCYQGLCYMPLNYRG
ncbi:hypothetical protein niasHS_005108 [Heterodera schachtii]|uniref:SCP domain-containing protein n=2 Tax=Heterodera TaxID=34509 RepID=A0ABD2JM92_HETSC